jgi:uncharacterized protein (TIGR00730 family)
MAIRSLAVFCGSKSGNDPLFCAHAKQLGYMLAQKNITLIYGGSSKGIMGEVANAVLEKNGIVIGIIPKILTEWEHGHQGISELYEVADMHTRKRMLYEKCDAALILPGGYGTMDELFEMLTWNQLNIHDKKIIILNTAGFYDHLVMHLKKMEAQNFLYNRLTDRLTIISSPGELVLD